MNQKVTVEYRTRKNYCSCCGQRIENPETSHERYFHFSKENFLEWMEQEYWKSEAENDVELNEIIREFVYETINFFATSSDTKILIDDSEFVKVRKFVLEEIVA
jgi:hypothetical protein